MSTMSSDDLSAILEKLDSRELRKRLVALEKERSSLMVLIRAARARERTAKRAKKKVVSHG